MSNTVTIFNKEYQLSVRNATVIHADKYSEASGGAFNLPVSSTLYTEAVFRLTRTGEDMRTVIQDIDLPVYLNQEVTLIYVSRNILAFVDNKTHLYYYTSRDLSRKFGLGYRSYWNWIIGIGLGIIFYFTTPAEQFYLWFTPLVLMWIFYYSYKYYLNVNIRKVLDKFLQE